MSGRDPRTLLAARSTSGTKHGESASRVYDAGDAAWTIGVNTRAGGYIDSIQAEDFGVGLQEIVNRGDCYTRGFQPHVEWTDAVNGTICHHHALQAGNVYSQPSGRAAGAGAAAVANRQMGSSLDPDAVRFGGSPIELDPDGVLSSAPGISGDHGGTPDIYPYWSGIRMVGEMLCHSGAARRMLLRLTLDLAEPIVTAGFDLAVGWTIFLLDTFNELRSYDFASSSDTQLALGLGSTGYYAAEHAAYTTYGHRTWRDGHGLVTGEPQPLPGLSGLIGAVNADELAVAFEIDAVSQRVRGDLSKMVAPNMAMWARNSTGTTGADGQQYFALGAAHRFTSRLYPDTGPRFLRKGVSVFEIPVWIGLWSQIKLAAA